MEWHTGTGIGQLLYFSVTGTAGLCWEGIIPGSSRAQDPVNQLVRCFPIRLDLNGLGMKSGISSGLVLYRITVRLATADCSYPGDSGLSRLDQAHTSGYAGASILVVF